MKIFDINADLGESFGRYKLGFDEEMMNYVTSINVACGFHAGDPMVIRRTVEIAKDKGVNIGAHPSYPDLQGFGRRSITMSEDEIENFVLYQIGALYGFLKIFGLSLHHVKPHGALYNDAMKNPEIARAIGRAVYKFDKDTILYGLSKSRGVKIWKEMGLKVFEEVFSDRNYNDDGSLVPRNRPNAVIFDLSIIKERIRNLIKYGEVESINGKRFKLNFDTICVHGDTERSVEIVKVVRELRDGS